jgi:flavin-dependent dehydrogenase
MIWEVIVAGAGPSAATAAHVLARAGKNVLMVDLVDTSRHKVGEALPSAAVRLLRSLDLPLPSDSRVHRRIVGNFSSWGSNDLICSDFIIDPDGPAWRLERHSFDAALRKAAIVSGAKIYHSRIQDVEKLSKVWKVRLEDGKRLNCKWLLDATGRRSYVSRAQGAKRQREVPLISLYALGTAHSRIHFEGTVVEAVREGWWYAASLPSGIPTAGLHVRPKDASRFALVPELWDKAWLATQHMNYLFPGMRSSRKLRPSDASGARLDYFYGDGWLACGDAALSFDQLSSQGLLCSLYSGMLAGNSLLSELCGVQALCEYADKLDTVWTIYRSRILSSYRQELRWSRHPFWKAAHVRDFKYS